MSNKIHFSKLSVFLLVVSIALITTGVLLGDNMTIFRKAIFICMECVGIA
ncbi:MAG: hypothetical protein IJJ70_05150 [Treponema sp.]|nr:hypothetical protein [Treponema sp.]